MIEVERGILEATKAETNQSVREWPQEILS